MSIYQLNSETDWVELSQARLNEQTTPNWSNLKQATDTDMNQGAGISINKVLKGPFVQIGKRSQLLDDSSKRKNYLCALFGKGNQKIPLAAYVISRVLPLINSY